MNIFGKSGPKDSNKEREISEREILVYKEGQKLIADKDIFEKQKEAFEGLHVARRKIIDARIEVEHEYNVDVLDKRVELAELNKEIDFKKEILAEVKTFQTVRAERDSFKAQAEASVKVIESKDKMIDTMDGIVKVVVGKLSTLDVKSIGLNVTATAPKE